MNIANSGVDSSFAKSMFAGEASKSKMLEVSKILKGDPTKGAEMASREFAGMFIGQMMKYMRATIDQSEFGHGGMAEEVFQEMLDQEYSRNAAYREDLDSQRGLVSSVYKSLKNRAAQDAYTKSSIEQGGQ